MADKNKRANGWHIRWSNYTEDNYFKLVEWCEKECIYWCLGREICPTTGTPHIQGCWYFKSQRWRNSLLKAWPQINYIQPMIASVMKNQEYCSKESNYLKGGELPSQGKRTDLHSLKEAILAGETTAKEIREADPHSYHEYGRLIDKLEDDKLSTIRRTERTLGVWFWGPSGVGKTYYANKLAEGKSVYTFPKADKGWWDHYEGQEVFILQDFRGQIPYDELLEIVDDSHYVVPRRGRCPYPFISKLVIVTCPLPPWEVYKKRHANDGLDQLMRRFEVRHLTTVYNDVKHQQQKSELSSKLDSLGITTKSTFLTRKWSGNNILDNLEVIQDKPDHMSSARTSSCICNKTFCECPQ